MVFYWKKNQNQPTFVKPLVGNELDNRKLEKKKNAKR
jgi:hypothetical protein